MKFGFMKKMGIILLVLVGCQVKEGTGEVPPHYRIAYNVWMGEGEKDDYEVFTMELDGSDRRNVTNLGGVEWTYHASGQDLLYISDRDTCYRCYFLYMTDAWGKTHRKVGDYQLRDSWQSSRFGGQEFIVYPKEDSAFYIIDREGALVDRVYPGLPYFSDPSFSPDGSQVVFRGSKRRFKKNIGYQDELYVVNVDGSGLRQLTHYPEDDTTASWYEYHAGPPFWEPNRNIITFHSVQGGGSFLFEVQTDGSGLRRLTPDSLRVGWHAWSPDGKMIAMDVASGADPATANYDIYLMEYESGVITRLTSDTLYEQGPVFVEVKD